MQKSILGGIFWVCILFAFPFGVNGQRKLPINGLTLKVMTFNTHHCNPPGEANRIDVMGIASAIIAERPDLVALQEIDVHVKRSGYIDEVALIAKNAGYKYYYFAKTIDLQGGAYGIALLSKYPLSDTITYKLPSVVKAEPRVMASAVVHLPTGKQLRFASIHLDAYHEANRLSQIQKINQLAKASRLPFIIAGDFNAHERSMVIDRLDEQFSRTCQSCPPTFDEHGQSDAIDYIAYRDKKAFKVISHKVLTGVKASDHFPLVTVLQAEF